VQASGLSRAGEPALVRDGDWMLLRWTRGEPLGAAEEGPAIFQQRHATGATAFQVERLRRGDQLK